MRRSASEIIRNLERRIARLEKASRYDDVEVDPETGELVDPEEVAELIDMDDVAYEMLDDPDFQELVEESGEDADELSARDLNLEVESSSAGTPSERESGVFYFLVHETEYDFAALVSVNLEGDPSIDHVGSYSECWRMLGQWT